MLVEGGNFAPGANWAVPKICMGVILRVAHATEVGRCRAARLIIRAKELIFTPIFALRVGAEASAGRSSANRAALFGAGAGTGGNSVHRRRRQRRRACACGGARLERERR